MHLYMLIQNIWICTPLILSETISTEMPPQSSTIANPSATDAELTQLAQQMWNVDINRFPSGKYTLHLQGYTNESDTNDRAPRR